MRTLAEIEKVLPRLSTEELIRLDTVLDDALRFRRKVFTAKDAAGWWRGHGRMTEDDGEAFALDVEAGRGETNLPPGTPRWE